MAEGLGRTVLHRHRYARVWGLGNRSSPAVKTPALISTEDDDDACKDLAAFHCLQTRTIPAEITVSTHHHLIPPDFQQVLAHNDGICRPCSSTLFEEANAGESADSWATPTSFMATFAP